jgi:hypothetical protein
MYAAKAMSINKKSMARLFHVPGERIVIMAFQLRTLKNTRFFDKVERNAKGHCILSLLLLAFLLNPVARSVKTLRSRICIFTLFF